MSASDLEAFKRAVDAYNRADVEALMAELDPEVEWHPALPGLLAASAPVCYLDPEEALEAAGLKE